MIELIAGSVIALIALMILFKLLTDSRSVVFDLLVGPIFLGILVFLSIYFILPAHISQATIVTQVGETLVSWTNTSSTNPAEAQEYIAGLSLESIAIAAGVISFVALLLIGLVKQTVVFISYRIIHMVENLKRNKKVKLNMSKINKHAKNQSNSYEVVYAQGMDAVDSN